jgi:hypothetical protein
MSPRTRLLAVASLKLSLVAALIFPTTATAEGVGRCIDEVETYRSVVIHRGDDNGQMITLPDTTSFELLDDQAIIDTNFWEDPLDDLAGFSIRRTMRNLVVTDPLAPEQMTELEIEERMDGLAQSWIDSISSDASFVETGEGLAFELDGRPAEAALDLNDFYALEPVAILNRIDDRDALGVTCGEHRVVYQIEGVSFQKMLLIFEARIENPRPERGQSGCLPLAKHWAETGDIEDQEELADHLEELYFDGIPGFKPAIHFEHLGAPFGQVRGNLFMEFNWQLREWRIGNSADPDTADFGHPTFSVESVGNTALAELYMTEVEEAMPENVVGDEETWVDFLGEFQESYQLSTMPSILAPEHEGIDPSEDGGVSFVGAMSAPVEEHFEEFQATSHFGGEIVPALVSNEMALRIACWLEGAETEGCEDIVPAPDTATVTVDHVIERTKRAGTCDGCHRVGSSAEVAPGIFWPQDRAFMHVTTTGTLSDALHGTFLPPRSAGLVSMIQGAPVGDVNLDGAVNVNDLLDLIGRYGTANDEFDHDCDGFINVNDLLAVLSNFGSVGLRMAPPRTARLEAKIADWKTARPKARAAILQDIIAQRETLRALEESQAGPNGAARRTH